MNGTLTKLDVVIDDAVRADEALIAAVGHATDYFQNDYSDLPEEEELEGATLSWMRARKGLAAENDVIARFEERYRDRQAATILKPIQLRHILDSQDREMEMRSLLRSVIQLRLKIVAERKRRLIEQLHAEEEQEHAL